MAEYNWCFPELKDEDVQSLEADNPDTARKKMKMKKGKKVTEGSKKISWTWCGTDADDELNSSVCVEWLKARARFLQWHEELLLLPEEIRWTIKTHVFKAKWWVSQAALHTDVDLALREGLIAYAARQAAI
ncbi:uncharacterized protein PHACADRAFT_106917 [Phanerochaete carnosa HHB-10118-sp]|uniref:Uncharacterized protein n=1 Tax=Phanerochaete carnosa (strain HHB-10118-sp) TaxID=650164 RepID=K5VRQ5_PHACS|nr:uncharacterized protein PHACADRAFT_106917 [Phanerochaete carnosa HHB-10118-sp]EKM49440.1 hypothetical protein PHACADRAFT_106917 [Phanerochaete carnosa HHB-10118-sp]